MLEQSGDKLVCVCTCLLLLLCTCIGLYFIHTEIVVMAQTEESVVKVDLNVVVGAEEEAAEEGDVEVEEDLALRVGVVVVVLAPLEKGGESSTATVELTGREFMKM